MNASSENNILFGHAQGVRSDEWLVTTPFILSQVKSGFPVENPNIGSNKDTLMMNIPVKHWSLVLRPQHWGFFIFDTERAFSYYWNYKMLLLILPCFLMLMLITRSNFALSLFGAFWIFSSSFTQWWFSANVPELIGLAFLTTISFIYLLFSNKYKNIIIAGIVFLFSTFGFVIIFYPPFQVPLVFLCFSIFCGFLFRDWKKNFYTLKNNLKPRLLVIAVTLLSLVASLGIYITEIWNTIKAITSAVYPGKRFSVGGGGLWLYGEGYYTNLLTENNLTTQLGNMCESSNFINFFPTIFFAEIILFLKKIKIDPMILFLSTYSGAMFVWSVFGVNPLLAQVTLMSGVPVQRAIIATGVSAILLVVVFLACNYKFSKFISLSIMFCSFVLFWLLSKEFFGYTIFVPEKKQMIFVLVLVFVAIIALSFSKKYLFILAIVLLVLPNLKINPIIFGLGPLDNPQLSKIVSGENDKWLVYGDGLGPSYFKALGANVVNGVNYTPNMDLWGLFDPKGEFVSVYNRYAHIHVVDGGIRSKPFSAKQPDSFNWSVNPCDIRLKHEGINRIAFVGQQPVNSYECLELLSTQNNKFWLYKLK